MLVQPISEDLRDRLAGAEDPLAFVLVDVLQPLLHLHDVLHEKRGAFLRNVGNTHGRVFQNHGLLQRHREGREVSRVAPLVNSAVEAGVVHGVKVLEIL